MNRPDYLELALRDCGHIELRHEHQGRWQSGTFGDLDALRQAIVARADRGNLYSSINAPAIGDATNTMGGKAWRDANIHRVVRLLVDFDPVRPRGVPSTEEELTAAVDRRNRFVAAQMAIGWPHPALGMSGNGAHAMYRCGIHPTSDLAEQLADLYCHWQQEWSDKWVSFDPTVRNPARICRLYGTTNRKGEATLDRPHRVSCIEVPTLWSGVSLEQIAEAAKLCRRASSARAAPAGGAWPTGNGDYATLDAAAWFSGHGLYKRHLRRGVHAVHCPWASEHSTASGAHARDTVIFDAKAPKLWPRFFCHHAHCDGRQITHVMALWDDADDYCRTAFSHRRT